jgi:hypothetical protein
MKKLLVLLALLAAPIFAQDIKPHIQYDVVLKSTNPNVTVLAYQVTGISKTTLQPVAASGIVTKTGDETTVTVDLGGAAAFVVVTTKELVIISETSARVPTLLP